MLSEFPGIGRVELLEQPGRDANSELRRLPISRFPKYTIFYTLEGDAVYVHRVLQSARSPSLRLTDPS